jgi:hypothetical protein
MSKVGSPTVLGDESRVLVLCTLMKSWGLGSWVAQMKPKDGVYAIEKFQINFSHRMVKCAY